jgi:hypothetical protein
MTADNGRIHGDHLPECDSDAIRDGVCEFCGQGGDDYPVTFTRGATVAFRGDESGVLGTVTDPAPIDPDGNVHPGVVEVTWCDDGGVEYLDASDLWLVNPDAVLGEN